MQPLSYGLLAANSWSACAALNGTSIPACKCTSKDLCWPSTAEFDALNQTVSGNLIRGVPPGSVCYPNQPDFNQDRCNYVRQNWPFSDFHAKDPISIGFPEFAGNPCPPIYPNGTSVNGDPNAGHKGCSLGAYPEYALNATSIEDIQTVVRFAKEKNIRLNVKSTGHSVEGRSTAYDSISIWTHHYLSHEYYPSFRPDSCPASYPEHMAVTLAAGARLRDIYEFAYLNNVVVVGGSAEDVGIMGWFTAGGHGPLSSMFGQGSDNVLQVTLVTPDGNVVTANECQNHDLFWAIRGGGGGTFGVLTHVVMRAYPSPTVVAHRLNIIANNPDDGTAFWNTIAGVYSLLPNLKEKGFAGNIFMERPPQVPNRTLWWNFNLPNTEPADNTTDEAAHALQPLLSYLDSQSAHVFYNSTLTFHPTWFQSWNTTVPSESGIVAASGIAMASRLIPAAGLDNTTPLLSHTLQSISESVAAFQAHLAIHNPSPSSPHFSVPPTPEQLNRTSLPPHWRAATLQFFTVTAFPDYASAGEARAAFAHATNGPGALLKALAPGGGAYLNEGDAFDPDWRGDYFGGTERYGVLRRIKDMVDPDGQLWCVSCVGSEGWREEESGGLCRVG